MWSPRPGQLLVVPFQGVASRSVQCVQQRQEVGQGHDAVCADGDGHAPLLQQGESQYQLWEQQASDT